MAMFYTPDAKRDIDSISRALAPLGITLPKDITAPIEGTQVRAPNTTELAAAVRAAKGDPGNNKEVQRLLTLKALHKAGVGDAIILEQWQERGRALRALRDTLNAQIHDVFNEAARELEDAASNLRGYEDVNAIVVSKLPRPLMAPARQALDAHHRLLAAETAWKAVHARIGGQQPKGREAAILSICDPSPAQWMEHARKAPQTLPAPRDAWTIVRYGWPLSLADNLHHAAQRYENIRDSVDADREARQLHIGRIKSWGTYR